MKKNDRKKQTAFLFSQETKEGLEPVTGIPKGKGLCLPKGEKPRYTGTLLTVAAAVLLLGASTLMVHGFSAQRVAAVEMEQTEKDQLNVVPAVENVMETVAENGKVYAYYYGLEHQEEIIQKRKKLEEAEVERLKSDPAVSEKDRSILLEDVQEQLEKTESELRAAFEREASYQPVISPQEAANIAGVFIERAYGVDLTQKELQINLAESDSNMLYRPAGRGMLRLIWYVMAEESSGKGSVTCTLDATTGELIAASYCPSEKEYEQIKATNEASCIQRNDLGDIRQMDPADAAWEKLREKILEDTKIFLSQSGLDSEPVKEIVVEQGQQGDLCAKILYENGKESRLLYSFCYPSLEWGGYPGCAYDYFNDSYLAA